MKMKQKVATVKLDGRVSGHIYSILGSGYQYFPQGSRIGGDVFVTRRDLASSLGYGATS